MIFIKKKKLLTGLLIGSLALLCFASGAIASSHLTKITAYINSAISVELKGKKLNLSDSKPITYNNTTYLPLRTIAEATGLDVKWDSENQRVQLNDKTISAPGVKKAFSKHDIGFKSNYTSNLLLKPTVITFSDKQYEEVIMVENINTSEKGFTLNFPKDTKKVGINFGTQGRDKIYDLTYTVYDQDENIVALGKLEPNTTTFVEFELSDAGTQLYFGFKSSGSGAKDVFLIYDESWYQ